MPPHAYCAKTPTKSQQPRQMNTGYLHLLRKFIIPA